MYKFIVIFLLNKLKATHFFIKIFCMNDTLFIHLKKRFKNPKKKQLFEKRKDKHIIKRKNEDKQERINKN